MRVGIIAIQHESNTFLPTPTTLDDFRRDALLCGPAIRDFCAGGHHEVAGFFAALDEAKVEAVPIILALATPGGPIADAAAEALIEMMLDELGRARTLDALLVAPHGAAVSESHRDLDGYWLALLRERLGPETPIIGTLDPHANLSPRMAAATDVLVAYRTNPHLDQRQTGHTCASLMVRTLRSEVNPVQALAAPPVAISIDRQATAELPAAELYALADSILRERGVLSNSVLLGFPYADVEELGSSFVVVTDGQPELAQAHADRLAQHLVNHRGQFACGLPNVEEALAEATSTTARVCLLDVGDNVGGGSPGDGPLLARELHRRGFDGAFVCLCDAEAVAKAEVAGVGNRLTLTMGGRVDRAQGPPLVAEVQVESLSEGRFEEHEARHGARSLYDMGRTAVVRTDGGLTVMLTTKRVPPFSLRQLTSCGLDPRGFRLLVAKGVNAPIAAYGEVCEHFIRAGTPGITCANMTQLEFKHRRRPLWPFEEVAQRSSS